MFLLFQSSFRLSEKNEKDKKRKELTPVSATPTHMLRICVNSPTMRVVDGADTSKIKPQYSQNKKCAFHSVSALAKPTPAPHIYMRACRQCVHESARLFRVICSHAW